ncbi:branched-chain amino acid ABC transporter permease/ATP-binding protein [Aldersonia kunmingensis]|uniref:branched-chain amino acid ABC transporter permease/ATP-binding protein n=1 Tax=Aldersonia kunmingensis TaxID=408066 RepID=UPI00082D3480|nr:branched-chain amino acid ABC transporter permease/ATP-binding protein [Aldersonia kunmingensis]
MSDISTYFVLGLGNGAVYAAVGLALVMTFKSSGVVNFATGAIALYTAYTYALLRDGRLMIPIPGLPRTADLGGPLGVIPAMALSLVIAAVLGVVLYALIFRPMRNATTVAKAVASIGLMVVIQALIAQRVGTESIAVESIFEAKALHIGEGVVPADRLWLAGLIVLIAAGAALVYRFTPFGIATEAAAESEKGAYVTGLSPDRIAVSNWALSSVVAGLGGILIAPMVPLNPIAYTMFIVPALAATLVGNFSSISLTVIAGLVIGGLQSEAVKLQATYDWMPQYGVREAIPLILILVFLVVKGRPLPDRGGVVRQTLGRAPRPEHILFPTVVGVFVAVIALFTTSGSYRVAIIVSIIFAIVSLSQVVVTGFAGQVSLAQLTLAGVAAFAVSVLNNRLGIPFPWAPLLAAVFAMVVGVIVGLPALRIRGLPLTVVTLALAVFLEAFWFRNPTLNGGIEGSTIDNPRFLGSDIGIGFGEGYPRIAFGIMCLILLVLVAISVARLRRSSLGAAMLAVRANERSAAAAGIDVSRTKLAAFAIGAFLAGIAGALLGYQQTVAAADSYSVFNGIAIFALLFTAGITSVSGGILAGLIAPGGVVYLLADRWLNVGDYYTLISGVLLILTVMLNPDGIVSRIPRIPIPSFAGRTRPADGPARAVLEPEAPGAPTASAAPAQEATAPAEPLLVVRDVGVAYGAVQAAADVSFEVYPGEIVGLIGPNGAGKTTVIDALTGFAHADGTVELGGISLERKAPHGRARLGLGRSFQDVELYDDLSVSENVSVGASNGAGAREAHARVDEVLRLLDIADVADRTVASLSQGQRQLVSVARVLASKPKVALLDEPAAGLDSTESQWLGEKLRAARNGGTAILLVDHDMELVLNICDRVIVLDLGRVIATGTPKTIRTNDTVIHAYLGLPAEATDLEHQAVPALKGQEAIS